MKEPFIITLQQYDRIYSIEIDHSDVNMDELYEAFRRLSLAAGFHPNTVDEYFGEQV